MTEITAKNKKKILYVITKGNWGGSQKYVFDLATSVPKDKFDVSVLLGEGNILEKKLHEKGIDVVKIPEMQRNISLLKEFSTFFKILKVFREEKPDIVHLNSSKASGLGALAARLTRIPKIVFTVHGWAFNEPRLWWQKIVIKFLSWVSILLSTEVIVISINNLRQARSFPFAKKKLFFIYNGIKKIDFKDRRTTRKFISEVTRASEDKYWLTTIAELHQNKGLEYAIRAMTSLKDKAILFIIGEGEERPFLEKLIRELDLEKNVYLMGFVEEASKHLKAFDIFILPSVKEGHPYTLLEAGLAGLPSIGSNIPGIKDILNEESGILVEEKNSEEIANAINNLIENKENMAELRANLREKIQRKFSFEEMVRETIKVYSGDGKK